MNFALSKSHSHTIKTHRQCCSRLLSVIVRRRFENPVGLCDLECLSVWRLSVAYIGPKSRTERPKKTKIGTEVAHVTRDSDTTFKLKKSKVNLQGSGHIVAAPAQLVMPLPHRAEALSDAFVWCMTSVTSDVCRVHRA